MLISIRGNNEEPKGTARGTDMGLQLPNFCSTLTIRQPSGLLYLSHCPEMNWHKKMAFMVDALLGQ